MLQAMLEGDTKLGYGKKNAHKNKERIIDNPIVGISRVYTVYLPRISDENV